MPTMNKQELLSFIFSARTAKDLQAVTSPECFDPLTFAGYCQEKLDSLPDTEHTIKARALLTEACSQFKEMAEQEAEQTKEKTSAA